MVTQKDIDKVLKDLSNFVRNDKLKDVEVVKIKLRNRDFPQRYLGGFAAACHVKSKIFDSALRIWTKKIDGIKDRTKIISDYLGTVKTNKKYFYNYEYIDDAIIIGNEVVDAVLMDWINGDTLYKFIEKNLDKPDSLRKVAENCIEMFKWMREKKISHGDLQHGNIIVDSKLNVHLCDYDSVCVPGIEGKNIVTPGLPGYQHPNRFTEKNLKSTFDDDFFAEVVIYAGLLSLAENPKLWKHSGGDDTYLVVSEIDFEEIRTGETPKIVEEINKIKDDKARKYNQMLLQNIKCKKLCEIKTLDEVMSVTTGTGNTRTKQPDIQKKNPSANTGGPEKPKPPIKISKPEPAPPKQTLTTPTPPSSKPIGVCPHCNQKLSPNDYLRCNFCGKPISRPFPF